MIIRDFVDLCDFEAWCGGKFTLEFLIEHGDDETVQQAIEELYPNGIDKVMLNDTLWFDTEWIAEILGFETWFDYTNDRERRDKK